jgi:hypothetical protein
MEAEDHMDRPDFPTTEQVEKATHEQLARWYRFLPSGDTKEQQKIVRRHESSVAQVEEVHPGQLLKSSSCSRSASFSDHSSQFARAPFGPAPN